MNTSDHVTFSTYPHSGETQIASRRFRSSDAAGSPHVLFCGGFHSAMQGTKASAYMALSQKKGWNCTLFDYRGHGDSGGAAEQFTLSDWLDDTLAVLDELQQPIFLVGSSMGAWLATLAALQRPEHVAGLLLLAAAPDFLQELVTPRLTPAHIWDLQQGVTVNLSTEYDSPYPITQALLDSAANHSLLTGDALTALQCPLRMVHGMQDTDVPFEFSTRLLNALPPQHDARLTLLNNADHRLSDASSLSYVCQALEQFIQQTHESTTCLSE